MAKKAGRPKGAKNKTKENVPGAEALKTAKRGDNSRRFPEKSAEIERTEDEVRQLFIGHLQKINVVEARFETVKKELSAAYAKAKNEGYKRKQFQIARDLNTIKGESRRTVEVDDVLRVARWIGHPMGAQLDLFTQPDRTPLKERAYDAGKQASMENEPRKPPHAPETEASRAWFAGYDEHQRELAGGFKAPKGGATESRMANAEPDNDPDVETAAEQIH